MGLGCICLVYYTQGHNFVCSDAKVRTDITRLPFVLFIKINREFSKDGASQKDMHAMALPNEIVISGTRFIKAAVVNHEGKTIAHGHYVAFVRPDGVTWLERDDARDPKPVAPSGHEEAIHSQSCGVFYTQAVSP